MENSSVPPWRTSFWISRFQQVQMEELNTICAWQALLFTVGGGGLTSISRWRYKPGVSDLLPMDFVSAHMFILCDTAV